MTIPPVSKVSTIFLTAIVILLWIELPLSLLPSHSNRLISPVVRAAPLTQNPYPACPPNSNSIWVRVDFYHFGNPETVQIPFESGDVTLNGNIYVNYLLGVLLAEIGPATDFRPVDQHLMRAMAILARTVAYKNCGCEILASNPGCSRLYDGQYRGMDDNEKQVYDPQRRSLFSEAERDLYQQAIDDTAGVYLSHNGVVFDAQYRASSAAWTLDYGGSPHIAIYDPAGRHHSGVGNQPGFPQKNANHYAQGENHDDLLPPYDGLRLLAHYLTAIGFVGLSPAPPDDYRFNVLHFGGMDDRANNPLILRSGQAYPTRFIVQNSGHNDWSLTCYTAPPWHDTALAFHWYSYPTKQYISPQIPYFEGARTALCLCTAPCTATLPPGQDYPDQSQGSNLAYANLYVNVPPGEYWLRLDLEFRSASIWGSRLHPQNNQNDASWPTQDVRVWVILNTPPAPDPQITSGQSAGMWSSNNHVTLAWQLVNDPLVSHYRVCWAKRNDGQGGSCSNQSGSSYARTLPDGIYDFEVTASSSDGQQSDAAFVDNIRLDVTWPTVQLNPLPLRIQAPDYVLTWSSQDLGGSGLAEQQLRYQINNNGLWRTVAEVSQDDTMRSIRFYFPAGQQGDVYDFCLQNRDGAGNWSVSSCQSTRYNPDPDLYLEPLQLTWYSVYSNTIPHTKTVTIENHGGDVLNWVATTPFTLAALGQSSGSAPSLVSLVLTHPVGITATYRGYITVSSSTTGTHNSPQVIAVTIYVREKDTTTYLPLILKQV